MLPMEVTNMCHRPRNNDDDRYGDGDVPEVDYEPYRNGCRVVTPEDPIPTRTGTRSAESHVG